ncbi:MAG: hypothetical protein U0Q55_06390 [Vicinamibacterales bacterium]
MTLVFYISGHGFGHAARSTQLIAEVRRREPAIRVVIRTQVPEWFLRTSLDAGVSIVPGATDTGVVQPDSLTIDEAATAARAAAFYREFDAHTAREAAFLRREQASLVVADIPPVAFAAAAVAGVPSVAFGNFTWDWIYSGFPGFDLAAPGVRERIREAQRQATQTLRLPFAGGFEGMANIFDVPLVGRRATRSRADVRARLGLDDARPVVLATFGGHGGNVPLTAAADNREFLLVATDYEAGRTTPAHPNLRVVRGADLEHAALTYTDLLGACDVVATKLGYGIVSECLLNGVPLLYALREHFIEQEVFIREMPAVMRAQFISREDLRTGHWAPAVRALLAQPAPPSSPRHDGVSTSADRLLALAHGG